MSERVARSYYDAIDGKEYDRLADLLAPGFVHPRPDRTIEGSERFVRFMREDRPQKETSHELRAVYDGPEGHVAARGQLRDSEGDTLFEFLDTFELDGGRIAEIWTYTA